MITCCRGTQGKESFLKILILLILSVYTFQSHSQTVVVSDVDDTIKVSHVLDLDSAAGNSLKVGNVFRGMSELYSEIRNFQPMTQFYYLTNAPERPFSNIHGIFLKIHNFPVGRLVLRKSLRDKNHKVNSLRNIIELENPKVLILIGDNGERDPAVYNQIKNEFPEIQILTFIREAYSSKNKEEDNRGTRLFKDQIGFVTPTEIALKLQKENFLSSGQVDSLEFQFAVPTLSQAAEEDDDGETGTLSFPNWIDCRDHQASELLRDRSSVWARQLVARIQERCSVRPFDD